MGPAVQYATERPDAPYEIRIYPGADAAFTLYEDDNETYAYERGQRATYDLTWHDATKTLHVGAREGSFPGLIATRELNVAVVDPTQPAKTKTVRYTGAPLELNFQP
jgi:alpha-D-xyloside xylohydrolase